MNPFLFKAVLDSAMCKYNIYCNVHHKAKMKLKSLSHAKVLKNVVRQYSIDQ